MQFSLANRSQTPYKGSHYDSVEVYEVLPLLVLCNMPSSWLEVGEDFFDRVGTFDL